MDLINFRILFLIKTQKAMRLLCLIVFCTFPFSSKSQSYYYFVNEIATKSGTTLSYKTLLTLQPDGSATARVQYNAGADNKLFLYQLSLSDSSVSITDTAQRFIIPNAEPLPLLEKDPATFFIPRFIFKKKYDSAGYYYDPSSVEVKMDDGKWQPVKTISAQQKTYDELRSDEPFVSSFYFETDGFYSYLFGDKTRSTPPPRPEKMYLILVGNTNDEEIGNSVKTDLQNVSGLFTKLAGDLGIRTVIPLSISGNDYSKLALQGALATLERAKPSPIDIVIFYYSGHGFRLPGDKSAYPKISFRTPKNRIDNVVGDYMALEDVYERIAALKPKVCIVLGDCCNANISDNPIFAATVFKQKGGGTLGDFNMDAGKKLFFPALPLSMIVGSVAEGHLSLGNPDMGGYFTHFFTAALEKNLWGYYSNNIFNAGTAGKSLWLQLLVAARTNTYWQAKSIQCGTTANDRCIQQAVIKIDPM
jgi:hypothetical protein